MELHWNIDAAVSECPELTLQSDPAQPFMTPLASLHDMP